jgi:hypothetical protein
VTAGELGGRGLRVSLRGFKGVLVVLVLLISACVRSQAVPCGDLLCPEGLVCTKGNSCVSAALATACSGRADGAACSLTDLGDGSCADGLCIIGRCGDGIVNGIEACDGADLAGKTCMDFGSTQIAGLVCAADCSFDKSGCNDYCGDGKKAPEEQCEGDDFGGLTCTDFAAPGATNKFYQGGVVTCTIDCMVNVSSCTGGWCGDGVTQFGEDCDGTNFGDPPATCMSLGHPGDATPPTCDLSTCIFTEDSCSCGLEGICPVATPMCVNNEGAYSCQ